MANFFASYPGGSANGAGGGGGGSVTWAKDSFAINGTAVYTLTNPPIDPETLDAFVNGVYQSGFTLVGSTVTFSFTPVVGPVEFTYRVT